MGHVWSALIALALAAAVSAGGIGQDTTLLVQNLLSAKDSMQDGDLFVTSTEQAISGTKGLMNYFHTISMEKTVSTLSEMLQDPESKEGMINGVEEVIEAFKDIDIERALQMAEKAFDSPLMEQVTKHNRLQEFGLNATGLEEAARRTKTNLALPQVRSKITNRLKKFVTAVSRVDVRKKVEELTDKNTLQRVVGTMKDLVMGSSKQNHGAIPDRDRYLVRPTKPKREKEDYHAVPKDKANLVELSIGMGAAIGAHQGMLTAQGFYDVYKGFKDYRPIACMIVLAHVIIDAWLGNELTWYLVNGGEDRTIDSTAGLLIDIETIDPVKKIEEWKAYQKEAEERKKEARNLKGIMQNLYEEFKGQLEQCEQKLKDAEDDYTTADQKLLASKKVRALKTVCGEIEDVVEEYRYVEDLLKTDRKAVLTEMQELIAQFSKNPQESVEEARERLAFAEAAVTEAMTDYEDDFAPPAQWVNAFVDEAWQTGSKMTKQFIGNTKKFSDDIWTHVTDHLDQVDIKLKDVGQFFGHLILSKKNKPKQEGKKDEAPDQTAKSSESEVTEEELNQTAKSAEEIEALLNETLQLSAIQDSWTMHSIWSGGSIPMYIGNDVFAKKWPSSRTSYDTMAYQKDKTNEVTAISFGAASEYTRVALSTQTDWGSGTDVWMEFLPSWDLQFVESGGRVLCGGLAHHPGTRVDIRNVDDKWKAFINDVETCTLAEKRGPGHAKVIVSRVNQEVAVVSQAGQVTWMQNYIRHEHFEFQGTAERNGWAVSRENVDVVIAYPRSNALFKFGLTSSEEFESFGFDDHLITVTETGRLAFPRECRCASVAYTDGASVMVARNQANNEINAFMRLPFHAQDHKFLCKLAKGYFQDLRAKVYTYEKDKGSLMVSSYPATLRRGEPPSGWVPPPSLSKEDIRRMYEVHGPDWIESLGLDKISDLTGINGAATSLDLANYHVKAQMLKMDMEENTQYEKEQKQIFKYMEDHSGTVPWSLAVGSALGGLFGYEFGLNWKIYDPKAKKVLQWLRENPIMLPFNVDAPYFMKRQIENPLHQWWFLVMRPAIEGGLAGMLIALCFAGDRNVRNGNFGITE